MLSRSLYIFASKMLGLTFRFMVPYALTRMLTQADFGAYRQFFLIEVMFAIVFQLGINQGLYYFIPRDEKNAGAYFVNSLMLNVVIFGTAFAVAAFFLDELSAFLQMDLLKTFYPELVAYTMIMMLCVAGDCYVLARKKVRQAAAIDIMGQVLTSVGTVLVAWQTRDLEVILRFLVAARLFQLVVVVSYIHFGMRGFRSETYFMGLREQIRYGVLLGLGGTVWTILMRMHNFVFNRYYGTEAFAVYSAGCTQVPVVEIYMQSIAVVALGQFAAMDQQGDHQGIRDLWRRIQTSIYGVAVPSVVALILASELIIGFLFPPEYGGAVDIFRLNSLAYLNVLFNATLILRAMDRVDIVLRWHLVLLAVAPFAQWGGMKLAGPMGIIAAHVVIIVFGRLVLLHLLNRTVGGGLIYVARPAEVWTFYLQSLAKVRSWVTARLPVSAGGS